MASFIRRSTARLTKFFFRNSESIVKEPTLINKADESAPKKEANEIQPFSSTKIDSKWRITRSNLKLVTRKRENAKSREKLLKKIQRAPVVIKKPDPKHPGLPVKPPANSFSLFVLEEFAKMAAEQHKSAKNVISEILSPKWKNLTSEQKLAYKCRHAYMVKDYEKAIMNLGPDARKLIEKEEEAKKQRKAMEKTFKDQLKVAIPSPKPPPTPFSIYLNKCQTEAPPDGSKKMMSVIRKAVDNWRLMDKDQKQPFFDQALRLAAEYRREYRKWKLSGKIHPPKVASREEQEIKDEKLKSVG